MAITLNNPTLVTMERARRGKIKCANFTGADLSGGETVEAAPGAGKHIHITSFVLQSDDADAHPVLKDASAALFGPLMSAVEGPSLSWEAPKGFAAQLTANQALTITATAGNVTGIVNMLVDQ